MTTHDSLRERLRTLRTEQTERAAEIARLEDTLKHNRKAELGITDHAQVRYVERVLGYDPKAFADLVATQVAMPAFLLGNGKYPLCPGFVAVVHNRTVVTVEPA